MLTREDKVQLASDEGDEEITAAERAQEAKHANDKEVVDVRKPQKKARRIAIKAMLSQE